MWTMDSGSGYYPVSRLQPTESMSSKLATDAVGFQVGLILVFPRFNHHFYFTCFGPHRCNALKSNRSNQLCMAGFIATLIYPNSLYFGD